MNGDRTDPEQSPSGLRAGASTCEQSGLVCRKAKADTETRDDPMRKPSRNSARIENGPGRLVLAHRPGPDLSPAVESGSEAYLSLPEILALPRAEAQKRVIEALEVVREKPGWLLAARELGLTHAEIAVVLGVTEPTVRQAVKRAKDAQAKAPSWGKGRP